MKLTWITKKKIEVEIDRIFNGQMATNSINNIVQSITKIVEDQEDQHRNFQNYTEDALRTCKVEHQTIHHGIIGISTEAGELLDIIKKNVYYDKPVDFPNLNEELGDLMWYVAIICHAADFNFEAILNTNINKLRTRYPDKFTNEYALNRNLTKEREGLENDLATTNRGGETKAVSDKADAVDQTVTFTDKNIPTAG